MSSCCYLVVVHGMVCMHLQKNIWVAVFSCPRALQDYFTYFLIIGAGYPGPIDRERFQVVISLPLTFISIYSDFQDTVVFSLQNNMDDMSRIPPPSCAKVFIQRDYSEGTLVRFSPKFPQELEGKVGPNVSQYISIFLLYSGVPCSTVVKMLDWRFSGCKPVQSWAAPLGIPCCIRPGKKRFFFL